MDHAAGFRLPRATPGSLGVSPRAIATFLNHVQAAGLELHSLMLFHRGHVIAEGWWAPYRHDLLHMQHSLSKSFTATAIGLAIGEGLLSLDSTVVGFFPDEAAQADANQAAMTIRHLLTMTSGHRTGISGDAWRQIRTSWVAEFFKAPVVDAPGTRFVYSSASSYMLSAILQRVTGERLHDYLRPRLFEPLGIGGTRWDVCPNGVNPGGNGLSCRTEDMLKLAVLHLQQGQWGGRQILSPDWVRQATQAKVAAPDGPDALHLDPAGPGWPRGYGYQWWTGPAGASYASGLFGQYAIVLPRHDAAIAVTAALRPSDQRLLDLVWRDLLPALDDDLGHRLAGLRLDLPAPTPAPSSTVQRISGRWFHMEPNEHGVQAARLRFEEASATFQMRDARGEHSVEVGLTGWIEGETSMTGNDLHHQYQPDAMRVSAAGHWPDDTTFVMTWVYLEAAFRDQVTCRFDADGMTLDRSVNVNTGAMARPSLRGRMERQRGC